MATNPRNASVINPIEKRVILTAILFSSLGLGLISFAAWGMGISVPDCVPNSKIFEHGSVTQLSPKNYEVHVLASMWGFEPSRIVVPVGSSLDLFVISKDVTHGFFVVGTNVNLMVEPAVVSEARVHFDRAGVFPVLCHEYCGVGHQAMNAVIEVSDTASDISAEGLPSAAPASASPGRTLLEQKGCLECHSLDGSVKVGPTFKGLWGSKVELKDGSSVTANEEYIEEMIEAPGKKVVKGFPPIMPKLPVTHEEIEQIIDFLKAVK